MSTWRWSLCAILLLISLTRVFAGFPDGTELRLKVNGNEYDQGDPYYIHFQTRQLTCEWTAVVSGTAITETITLKRSATTLTSFSATTGTHLFATTSELTQYIPDEGDANEHVYQFQLTAPKQGGGTVESNIVYVKVGNRAPTADGKTVNDAVEDTAKAITLTGSDPDTDDNDSLSFRLVSGPSHGTITGGWPTVTYTPTLNYMGSDSFTYKVRDDHGLDSSVATVSITVTAVNDPPTLDPLENITINEDAGLQTVYVSGIASGGAGPGGTPQYESDQALSVTVSSGNTAVIPTPSVNYTSPNGNGTITFTPVANAYTTTTPVTITVRVTDNGTTDGASDPKYIERSFTVTVKPVNDYPTMSAINDAEVLEDSGQHSIGLSGIGPGGGTGSWVETSDRLDITVESNDTDIIKNLSVVPAQFTPATSNGLTATVYFTPEPNAFTTTPVTITVRLADNGSTDGHPLYIEQTFKVTVNPVNDPPTFAWNTGALPEYTLPLLVVNTGASRTLANFAKDVWPGEKDDEFENDTQSFTPNPVPYSSCSNSSLFTDGPKLQINQGNHTADLLYTCAPYAHGQATVSFIIVDSLGLTATELSFDITIVIPENRSEVTDEDQEKVITLRVTTEAGENPDLIYLTATETAMKGPETGEPGKVLLAPPGTETDSGVTYQPAQDFNSLLSEPANSGPDWFTFTVQDQYPAGESIQAVVLIFVNPVNDLPIAGDVYQVVQQNSEDNSIDIEGSISGGVDTGETYFVTGVGKAAHGTVDLHNNVVTYTPDTDYLGHVNRR